MSDGTVSSPPAPVSITVTAVNDAPTANAQAVTTAEDTAVAITLTGSDPDDDALTFTVATQPANGTLSGTAPNLTYTPNANFNGADSFTFTVNDGTIASAAAMVSITVTAVNDAPTANAQAATTAENTAVAIILTGSDPDGDALTFTVATQPANGTLSGTAPNLTYTPNADYNGADSFTFTVTDTSGLTSTATVSVTITPIDNGPQITSVHASSGSVNGGDRVTISGTFLTNVSSVTFGGVGASIISVDANSVTVVAPPHAAGIVDIVVTTTGGVAAASYTYVTSDSVMGTESIFPVVGSTPGGFNSFFKTAMQLHNPTSAPIRGRLVFHRQGASGDDGDPSLEFALAAGQTTYLPDLLPMLNLDGMGSVDLIVTEGTAPVSVVRIYNDAGEHGTTGVTTDAVRPADALHPGESGVLLAPASTDGYRFNVGVRTLSEGAAMQIVVRNAEGEVVHELTKSFPSSYFTQVSAAELLGAAMRASDSISFTVTSGAAIVYGSVTDNITQDPSYQLARKHPHAGEKTMTIPVVGSTAGGFGSFFRTAMQLHNPTTSEMRGRLVFRPASREGSVDDTALSFVIKSGATTHFSDFLPLLGLSGLGSVDIEMATASAPLSVVRIYNDRAQNGITKPEPPSCGTTPDWWRSAREHYK